MSFRRRKQNKGPVSQTSVEPCPSPPAVPVGECDKGPVIPPVLIASVERAADLAKRELTDTGRITPRALFVYDGKTPPSERRITVVSLAWRNEFQKDALRERIRDKALQENARAVVVTGVGSTEGRCRLTLSGMTREAHITATVDYAFDRGTKTIGRWEFQWLSETHGDVMWGVWPDWRNPRTSLPGPAGPEYKEP